MFLWSAQAIYARAFYAAGNTLVPMVAGTIVTAISWPIYGAFYHWHGAMGLAIASDIGIALQTGTVAVLLHQRRMVSLASLDYRELARCLLAAAGSGATVWTANWGIERLSGHLWVQAHATQIRLIDLAMLVAGTALWVLMTKWILERAGSALPRVILKRLKVG